MLILYSRGVTLARHYLVDFLLLGPPSTQACQAALCSTLSTCEELGLPVAPEKTEGPGCSPSWGLKLTRWPVSYVFPKKNYGTNHLQMDAIWAKTSATTFRQKSRLVIADWPPQSCCHGGAAWSRLFAQPYRCFCNNSSLGSTLMRWQRLTSPGGTHSLNTGMVLAYSSPATPAYSITSDASGMGVWRTAL